MNPNMLEIVGSIGLALVTVGMGVGVLLYAMFELGI